MRNLLAVLLFAVTTSTQAGIVCTNQIPDVVQPRAALIYCYATVVVAPTVISFGLSADEVPGFILPSKNINIPTNWSQLVLWRHDGTNWVKLQTWQYLGYYMGAPGVLWGTVYIDTPPIAGTFLYEVRCEICGQPFRNRWMTVQQ